MYYFVNYIFLIDEVRIQAAPSSSQVELELASQVLNALNYPPSALLQINIMGIEVLYSINATSIRS